MQTQCRSFTCGGVILCETDQASPFNVSEGSEFAVIVTITNLGETAGSFSTNFAFHDPKGEVIDGSRGPTLYHLGPGQSIVLDWHHSFGCTNRVKGLYTLGVGTSVMGVPVPCNNYNHDGGIGYSEMILNSDTICPGFTP
jgi:hypothetical protein